MTLPRGGLGEIITLKNVTILEGGLASVGTFTFSKDATNLTYQSMLNVANELPTYSDGEHIYTCPLASTDEEQRNDLRDIIAAKGWTMNFIKTSGEIISGNDYEASCVGTSHDTFTFDSATGALTLDWPTKSCGNPDNKSETTDFYTTYLANREIKSVGGSVPRLSNADQMFAGTSGSKGKITTCTFDNLDSLTSAQYMFNHNAMTSWNIDMPNLTNASYMFHYNTSLASFVANLDSLEVAEHTFRDCVLTEWTNELPKLKKGYEMFRFNPITEWNIDLPELNDGHNMFYNAGLTSWNGALPKLQQAYLMFYRCKFTSWNTELPTTLTNAQGMFYSSYLTSFDVELPNSITITNANSMFYNCQSLANVSFNNQVASGLTNCTNMFWHCSVLTTESCQNIVNMLPDVTGVSGTHNLGVQSVTNWTEEMTVAATAKGWTVTT